MHIAGTKGKGTTCLYTEHLIEAHRPLYGRPNKLGCLTSPHVTTVRERFRIDSKPVSESAFTHHFWSLWDRMGMSDRGRTTPANHPPAPPWPRYPGFLTLLGFYIFSQESVDLVILETGMGGETDSTNVVTAPIATGITRIGLDHTDRLGKTVREIAWHKAGILKYQVPAFSVPQERTAEDVLQARALEKGCSIEFVQDEFLVKNNIHVWPNIHFQHMNAALAVELVRAYFAQLTPPRDVDPFVAMELARTDLPAKFELVGDGSNDWLLSSAHNEQSIDGACQAFLDLLQQ